MSSWSEKSKRLLRNSSLMQPSTKYRRFVVLLPELEEALLNGHSHDACRTQLREVGLELSSRGFANYLYLARREMRRGRAPQLEAPPIQGAGTKREPTPAAEKAMESSGSHVARAERRLGGAIVTSARPKDRLTNKNPNLEDFL